MGWESTGRGLGKFGNFWIISKILDTLLSFITKFRFAYSSVFHPKRTPVSLYDKYRHDKKIKLKAGKAEEL